MNSILIEPCLIGRTVLSHSIAGGACKSAVAQARSMVEVHTGRRLHTGESESFHFVYDLGSLK